MLFGVGVHVRSPSGVIEALQTILEVFERDDITKLLERVREA